MKEKRAQIKKSDSQEYKEVFLNLGVREDIEKIKFIKFTHPLSDNLNVYWLFSSKGRKEKDKPQYLTNALRISPDTNHKKLSFSLDLDSFGNPKIHPHSGLVPFRKNAKKSSQNASYGFRFDSPKDLKEKLEQIIESWNDRSVSSETSKKENPINASVKGYCKVSSEKGEEITQKNTNQELVSYVGIEGGKKMYLSCRKERDPKLRAEFLKNTDWKCAVCGMVFEDVYGDVGRCFIEVHHVVPLAEEDEERNTTMDDLIALCSNCHQMIHRVIDKRIVGYSESVKYLKDKVEQNKKSRNEIDKLCKH